MVQAKSLYITLRDDPELEIPEGDSRESAAWNETVQRVRQHSTNTKALSMGNESAVEKFNAFIEKAVLGKKGVPYSDKVWREFHTEARNVALENQRYFDSRTFGEENQADLQTARNDLTNELKILDALDDPKTGTPEQRQKYMQTGDAGGTKDSSGKTIPKHIKILTAKEKTTLQEKVKESDREAEQEKSRKASETLSPREQETVDKVKALKPRTVGAFVGRNQNKNGTLSKRNTHNIISVEINGKRQSFARAVASGLSSGGVDTLNPRNIKFPRYKKGLDTDDVKRDYTKSIRTEANEMLRYFQGTFIDAKGNVYEDIVSKSLVLKPKSNSQFVSYANSEGAEDTVLDLHHALLDVEKFIAQLQEEQDIPEADRNTAKDWSWHNHADPKVSPSGAKAKTSKAVSASKTIRLARDVFQPTAEEADAQHASAASDPKATYRPIKGISQRLVVTTTDEKGKTTNAVIGPRYKYDDDHEGVTSDDLYSLLDVETGNDELDEIGRLLATTLAAIHADIPYSSQAVPVVDISEINKESGESGQQLQDTTNEIMATFDRIGPEGTIKGRTLNNVLHFNPNQTDEDIIAYHGHQLTSLRAEGVVHPDLQNTLHEAIDTLRQHYEGKSSEAARDFRKPTNGEDLAGTSKLYTLAGKNAKDLTYEDMSLLHEHLEKHDTAADVLKKAGIDEGLFEEDAEGWTDKISRYAASAHLRTITPEHFNKKEHDADNPTERAEHRHKLGEQHRMGEGRVHRERLQGRGPSHEDSKMMATHDHLVDEVNDKTSEHYIDPNNREYISGGTPPKGVRIYPGIDKKSATWYRKDDPALPQQPLSEQGTIPEALAQDADFQVTSSGASLPGALRHEKEIEQYDISEPKNRRYDLLASSHPAPGTPTIPIITKSFLMKAYNEEENDEYAQKMMAVVDNLVSNGIVEDIETGNKLFERITTLATDNHDLRMKVATESKAKITTYYKALGEHTIKGDSDQLDAHVDNLINNTTNPVEGYGNLLPQNVEKPDAGKSEPKAKAKAKVTKPTAAGKRVGSKEESTPTPPTPPTKEEDQPVGGQRIDDTAAAAAAAAAKVPKAPKFPNYGPKNPHLTAAQKNLIETDPDFAGLSPEEQLARVKAHAETPDQKKRFEETPEGKSWAEGSGGRRTQEAEAIYEKFSDHFKAVHASDHGDEGMSEEEFKSHIISTAAGSDKSLSAFKFSTSKSNNTRLRQDRSAKRRADSTEKTAEATEKTAKAKLDATEFHGDLNNIGEFADADTKARAGVRRYTKAEAKRILDEHDGDREAAMQSMQERHDSSIAANTLPEHLDSKEKINEAMFGVTDPSGMLAGRHPTRNENRGGGKATSMTRDLLAHFDEHGDNMSPETRKALTERLAQLVKPSTANKGFSANKGERFGDIQHAKNQLDELREKGISPSSDEGKALLDKMDESLATRRQNFESSHVNTDAGHENNERIWDHGNSNHTLQFDEDGNSTGRTRHNPDTGEREAHDGEAVRHPRVKEHHDNLSDIQASNLNVVHAAQEAFEDMREGHSAETRSLLSAHNKSTNSTKSLGKQIARYDASQKKGLQGKHGERHASKTRLAETKKLESADKVRQAEAAHEKSLSEREQIQSDINDTHKSETAKRIAELVSQQTSMTRELEEQVSSEARVAAQQQHQERYNANQKTLSDNKKAVNATKADDQKAQSSVDELGEQLEEAEKFRETKEGSYGSRNIDNWKAEHLQHIKDTTKTGKQLREAGVSNDAIRQHHSYKDQVDRKVDSFTEGLEEGQSTDDYVHSEEDHDELTSGPPDPEVAKQMIAQGYEWHEDTRRWRHKDTHDDHVKANGVGSGTLTAGNHSASGGAHGYMATASIGADGQMTATPDPGNFSITPAGTHAVTSNLGGHPPTTPQGIQSHKLGQALNTAGVSHNGTSSTFDLKHIAGTGIQGSKNYTPPAGGAGGAKAGTKAKGVGVSYNKQGRFHQIITAAPKIAKPLINRALGRNVEKAFDIDNLTSVELLQLHVALQKEKEHTLV